MSYAISAALQTAIYQALSADADVTALVGTDIYDALPAGTVPSLYIALGPEKASDASDQTGRGARHDFTVSVVTDSAGFASAKAVAAAVSDALVDAPLMLSRGRLVSLRFHRAKAVRVSPGDERRIDLTFRARVDDD
ncbi:DUF3168 domain-containing protein [Salibaculum griseiflavum]|uniref:DUF3168 domain-containing protein n=1 Tax=Salibaculum griseiflavum TaxID=1914409 RepID=A0A2V1PB87_9RHOB|nr:DUF3168 domain-containing protein [Salibaculum griseiflavum]PWG18272.1 DUF3168 domain-containing protein [Salibaculum griseiflavum]